MKRLLVIGGDGFIGRVLCRVARTHGVEVIAAVRGRPDANSTERHVDITDPGGVRRLLSDADPDAVVCLAAHGAADRGLLAGAEADPVRAVDVNVRGVAILLREAAAAGCVHAVLASSTTVYGPASCYSERRVGEQVPLLPGTVYGGT
ncbi:MAG: NAD-dependent epimerase/dehydratase family protein, partial [Nocardioidaceae bacterium]